MGSGLGRPPAMPAHPSPSVAPAHRRRAWKLARTLAEGAASLLATAWQRAPADLTTTFVPLAGAALERQVRW